MSWWITKTASPKPIFDEMIKSCAALRQRRDDTAEQQGEGSPENSSAAADLLLCQARAVSPRAHAAFVAACGTDVDNLPETAACMSKYNDMMSDWNVFWRRVWTPDAKRLYRQFVRVATDQCRKEIENVQLCLQRHNGDDARCGEQIGEQVLCTVRGLAPRQFRDYAECLQSHPRQDMLDGPYCFLTEARQEALDIHRRTLRAMGLTREEVPDTDAGRVYIEQLAPYIFQPEGIE